MIKNFFRLYFKSLSVVFKADKFHSVLLLAVIPLQALMPSLLIYSANKIINAVVVQTKRVSIYTEKACTSPCSAGWITSDAAAA